MKRKFVLLINSEDNGKICYRGEGTVEQIKNDLKKFDTLEDLEIVPVIGGRFQSESILVGSIIGAIVIGMGTYIYKKYHDYKKHRK
jgi:hypothetical protein